MAGSIEILRMGTSTCTAEEATTQFGHQIAIPALADDRVWAAAGAHLLLSQVQ